MTTPLTTLSPTTLPCLSTLYSLGVVSWAFGHWPQICEVGRAGKCFHILHTRTKIRVMHRLRAQDRERDKNAGQTDPAETTGVGAGGQRLDPADLMLSPRAAGETGCCCLHSRLRWGAKNSLAVPWAPAIVGRSQPESADSAKGSRKPIPMDQLTISLA